MNGKDTTHRIFYEEWKGKGIGGGGERERERKRRGSWEFRE